MCMYVLYVRLCAVCAIIDVLCASKIIFGKIYPLEMLFRGEFVVSCDYIIDSNLPQYFLESHELIATIHRVRFVNLSNRTVKAAQKNR